MHTKPPDILEGVNSLDALIQHYADQGNDFLSESGIQASQASDFINKLFEETLYADYFDPVLECVNKAGVDRSSEHARIIGVDKSTTSGWWRLAKKDKEKPSRISVPSSTTFLFTLAAFAVDPSKTIPHGRTVTLHTWHECISQVGSKYLPDTKALNQMTPEEIVCIHLVWNCQEWKEAMACKEPRGKAEKLNMAADWILDVLKIHFDESSIESLADIQRTVRRWFVPATIALALLKRHWMVIS